VQRELANPYELHRTLMSAYPDDLPEDERVLFRVETNLQGGAPHVLLQSHTRPDWAWLGEPEARDYTLAAPQTKSFELSFAHGQVLAFRLRANPTARRRLPDGSRKRVGLYREEEQVAWLQRKGEQGGFRVLSVRTSDESKVNGWVRRNGERHKLTLLSVQFDGLLEVTDPGALWRTVQDGVGSAKGLGFGLLSLAPRP
jgi:CRISPR system Cascade subunit CasE